MSNRSKLEIITAILKAIKDNTKYDPITKTNNGITKTKIMYLALLSNEQLKYYLLFCMDCQLIYPLANPPPKSRDKKPRSTMFCITEKGEKLIDMINEALKLIGLDISGLSEIKTYDKTRT
ncbi:MAG: winged helix-turn-helix domain-containing protein [Nitrososphaeraceae archaeon]